MGGSPFHLRHKSRKSTAARLWVLPHRLAHAPGRGKPGCGDVRPGTVLSDPTFNLAVSLPSLTIYFNSEFSSLAFSARTILTCSDKALSSSSKNVEGEGQGRIPASGSKHLQRHKGSQCLDRRTSPQLKGGRLLSRHCVNLCHTPLLGLQSSRGHEWLLGSSHALPREAWDRRALGSSTVTLPVFGFRHSTVSAFQARERSPCLRPNRKGSEPGADIT